MYLSCLHIPVDALSHAPRNFLEFPVSWSPAIILYHKLTLRNTRMHAHSLAHIMQTHTVMQQDDILQEEPIPFLI